MATKQKEMGKYCKAYPIERFQAYDGWSEKGRDNSETTNGDSPDAEFFYLQENYVVTDGIFKNENVVFDNVTDAWKSFCHDVLKFEIPHFEPIEIEEGAEAS